jgi:hypothetical protein
VTAGTQLTQIQVRERSEEFWWLWQQGKTIGDISRATGWSWSTVWRTMHTDMPGLMASHTRQCSECSNLIAVRPAGYQTRRTCSGRCRARRRRRIEREEVSQ